MADAPPAQGAPAAPSRIRVPTKDEYERLGRSALDHCTVHLTVEQRGENGQPVRTSGTGLVIRQAKPGVCDGLILTCLHVLQEGGREAARIHAQRHEEARFACEVEPVFVHADDDWAIVAFKDQPGKNPSEIPKVLRAERSPPQPGFDVGAEASPNLFLVDFVGADPRLRYQSALACKPELVHGRAPTWPAPADVLAYRYFVGSEPGSSGAALVNPCGEVLGLHGSSEPYGAVRLGRAVCIERILTRLRRQGIPTDFDAVPDKPTLLPPMVAQDVGGGTPSQGTGEASGEEDGRGARWQGVLAGIATAVLGVGAIFVVSARPPAVDFYNDLLGCWRTEDAAEHAAGQVESARHERQTALELDDPQAVVAAGERLGEWYYYGAFADYLYLVDCATPERPKACPSAPARPSCDEHTRSKVLLRLNSQLASARTTHDDAQRRLEGDGSFGEDIARRMRRRGAYLDWLELMVKLRFGEWDQDALLTLTRTFEGKHPCSKHVQTATLLRSLVSSRLRDPETAFEAIKAALGRVDTPPSEACAGELSPDVQKTREWGSDFGQLTMPELAHCYEERTPQRPVAEAVFCATYHEMVASTRRSDLALSERCKALGLPGSPAHRTARTLLEGLERRMSGQTWVVECARAWPPQTPRAEAASATLGDTKASEPAATVEGPSEASPREELAEAATPWGETAGSSTCRVTGAQVVRPMARDEEQPIAFIEHRGRGKEVPRFLVRQGERFASKVAVAGDRVVVALALIRDDRIEDTRVFALACEDPSRKRLEPATVARHDGEVWSLMLVESRKKPGTYWLLVLGADRAGQPELWAGRPWRASASMQRLERVAKFGVKPADGFSPRLELYDLERGGVKRPIVNVRLGVEHGELWEESPELDKRKTNWRRAGTKIAGHPQPFAPELIKQSPDAHWLATTCTVEGSPDVVRTCITRDTAYEITAELTADGERFVLPWEVDPRPDALAVSDKGIIYVHEDAVLFRAWEARGKGRRLTTCVGGSVSILPDGEGGEEAAIVCPEAGNYTHVRIVDL